MFYNDDMDCDRHDLLELLISRLEHLSSDSRWSHRASGLRGSLLNLLEINIDRESAPKESDTLIEQAFDILRQAALEIPDAEALLNHKGIH